MKRFLVAALVVIFCVTGAGAVYGQSVFEANTREPFSRIEFYAGGTYDVGASAIYDFWEPGYGGELTFQTPFYLGAAEAGAAYHRYDTATPDVPRFDALHVFAGWGVVVQPVSQVLWYNGIRLGNNRMTFDEETFPGVQNESEFLIGAQSKLTVQLFRNTGIYAAAHFTQTYTYIRFRTVYVSTGITTSISAPSWLRTFLR